MPGSAPGLSHVQINESGFGFDLVAGGDMEGGDGSGDGSAHGVFHFHGFEDGEGVAFGDLLADDDEDFGDFAGHGRGACAGVHGG